MNKPMEYKPEWLEYFLHKLRGLERSAWFSYKCRIGSKIFRQISKNLQLENKETARSNPVVKNVAQILRLHFFLPEKG